MGKWTVPGKVNPLGQKVIRNTGERGSHRFALVYEMECTDCDEAYGAKSCDIHLRKVSLLSGRGAAGVGSVGRAPLRPHSYDDALQAPLRPLQPPHRAYSSRSLHRLGQDLLRDGHWSLGWSFERPPMLLETSMPGVFAVGYVRYGSVKRVASAVGEGSIAIQMVHGHLGEI
jgi:hypothetical protein